MSDPHATTTVEPVTQRHQVTEHVSLVADHWGPTSPQPVLFLHGGGQTRHAWRGTAAALSAAGRQAITVDLRGHGDSDWAPDGAYGVPVYAQDIATLIADLGCSPILVGASLGGMTGMLLEGRVAPGSLAALVLVDIVPRMNLAGAQRVVSFMLEHAETGFASLDEVADAIAAYNPHRPRPDDTSGLKKNLRLRDGRWYWHWDPATLPVDRVGADGRLAGTTDRDMTSAALAAVEVPVMLVRGALSDLVTEDELAGFREEHPAAEYVDVREAGHMVAGDRNDAFTNAVSDFIDRLG